MTDTNKDKIRIDKAGFYKNEYKLTSNKFQVNPLRDFIDSEIYRVIKEVLYQTGEDFLSFSGCDIHISLEEEIGECNTLYKYIISSNIYYSELESDSEYKDRLTQLKCEEAKLNELAVKFGYRLEKVNE